MMREGPTCMEQVMRSSRRHAASHHLLHASGALQPGTLTVTPTVPLSRHPEAATPPPPRKCCAGDVLLHTVTDAILGALCLPDIGQLFPDTDPKWKGARSDVFLLEAVRLMRERGYDLGNIDCTIVAQRPKLSPHKETIRARLCELLGAHPSVVNVKARRGEGEQEEKGGGMLGSGGHVGEGKGGEVGGEVGPPGRGRSRVLGRKNGAGDARAGNRPALGKLHGGWG